MRRAFLATALAFLMVQSVSAQVAPDKALATFTVADGLELSMFASEPMFVNPTSIDVDHKGRVWVCEAVNYRRKNFGRPILRKEGDRIVVLIDKDGDGKADEAVTFFQSPEIIAPLGVCVAPYPDGKGQRVYVCQSPDILVFEDKDGDLKADGPPKKFLSGFRGVDHDHGVHGINIGPDGKLYFTVGDSGVDGLQSSDGKGRKWKSNDTDVRAGTVWRCDMDGKNLEMIAHNFRNNYECCVNSFGDIWLSDNDDDGNQQTRICYVMPGGNYGYHPRGPGQTHWHEEQPGIVHKVYRTGFGSPCGITFNEGSLLGKKYQGALLHADAGPREIRAFHLKAKGAGFEAEKELLVTSKDNWFRPSDVSVAPDGSIFIADWYDPGVGGHGMGDWTRGRIYRLTPKGHKGYKVPANKLSSTDEVVSALASPNLAQRHSAAAVIDSHNRKDALALLGTVFERKEDSALRARGIWQVASLGIKLEDDTLITSALGQCRLFEDSDMRFQATFSRIAPSDQAWLSHAGTREIIKGSAAGRRELALALVYETPKNVVSIFYELAKQYDGQDRFYLAALNIAAGTGQKRREAMLADFEKHFPEWNDKVADLVWELRPPSMMPKLGKMLGDKKLSASSRARIIDILASSDDKNAGKAMLDVLAQDVPAEVRDKVLANLKLFLPGKWKDLRGSRELNDTIDALLGKPATRIVGLDLAAVVERTDAIPDILKILQDSQSPQAHRDAAFRALGALPDKRSLKELNAFAWSKASTNAEPAVLALGKLASNAAKQHQDVAKGALELLQDLVRNEESPSRGFAAEALAGTRPGTVWLLELNDKKQLPEAIKANVARLLRNSPYQDLRNRAMVAFPPPGKIDPKKLPAIAALLARKGNVERGKQLFVASARNDMQCAKCHMVRGQGGQIGPDLSMIGKKASRENLYESILYPSKAIADQYINWQITTDKGVVLTGLIVEETPTSVVLRDANGKDVKLAKTEIENRVKSPKSLMADDIVVYMTEDDLIDVTEYMLTLKTPTLTPTFWNIVGPFDNGENDAGLDKVFPPEKEVDLKGQYEGKSGKVSWKTVRPDGTGYLDLMKLYAPNHANIVSHLYQEIESPVDQEAELLIGNDDGCKVWLNGEKVFEDRRHIAAAPEASRAKVKLKKGVNKVLVKIVNGDGPHGLYFTIVAENELKERIGK